jgi:hypothetical protein
MDTTPSRRSRRAILAAGVAGAAAVTASMVSRPATVFAGSDGDVVLGADNVATDVTVVQNSTSNGTGFQGRSYGTGPAIFGLNMNGEGMGVRGSSDSGVGVLGEGSTNGVQGSANSGRGVFGSTSFGVGVLGEAQGGAATGVLGIANVSGLGPTPSTGHGYTGVEGRADASAESIGVLGTSNLGTGMTGISGTTAGIAGDTSESGVYGYSDTSSNATGVWGDTNGGIGAVGTGDWGVLGAGNVGIIALSGGSAPSYPTYAAIFAYAPTTRNALQVNGKVALSRSGRISITAGHRQYTKTLAGVTSTSLVIATLQTLRSGIYIAAAVPAAGKFTVYLNKVVAGTTRVAFVVFN